MNLCKDLKERFDSIYLFEIRSDPYDSNNYQIFNSRTGYRKTFSELNENVINDCIFESLQISISTNYIRTCSYNNIFITWNTDFKTEVYLNKNDSIAKIHFYCEPKNLYDQILKIQKSLTDKDKLPKTQNYLITTIEEIDQQHFITLGVDMIICQDGKAYYIDKENNLFICSYFTPGTIFKHSEKNEELFICKDSIRVVSNSSEKVKDYCYFFLRSDEQDYEEMKILLKQYPEVRIIDQTSYMSWWDEITQNICYSEIIDGEFEVQDNEKIKYMDGFIQKDKLHYLYVRDLNTFDGVYSDIRSIFDEDEEIDVIITKNGNFYYLNDDEVIKEKCEDGEYIDYRTKEKILVQDSKVTLHSEKRNELRKEIKSLREKIEELRSKKIK